MSPKDEQSASSALIGWALDNPGSYWGDDNARALLPLAWLARIEDTPEHRRWLRRVAEDLVALQDSSGAIRETIGDGGPGTASNAENGSAARPANGAALTRKATVLAPLHSPPPRRFLARGWARR